MGTFSSKAASALDRVLKRSTLQDINKLIRILGANLDNEVQETASIERAADSELDIKYWADGKERFDRAPSAQNLIRELDGPSITRALSVATSALDAMQSKRSAWILEEKAKHEAGKPMAKWDESLLRHHGPGIIPEDNPI